MMRTLPGKLTLLPAFCITAALLALSLSGCSMTPEDKAFYGRGWINPDELDQDTPPPRSFSDPTAVDAHPLSGENY